jgi:hypothetical protein
MKSEKKGFFTTDQSKNRGTPKRVDRDIINKCEAIKVIARKNVEGVVES